jgi:hypothetical protein
VVACLPSSCVCVCVCRVVVWQSLSKPCDSSAECAPGSECVSLFDEPAFMSLLHSVKLTGDDDGSDLETCGGGAGLQKDVSGPQMQCDGDVGAQQSVQIGRDSLVLGCVLCTLCGWYARAVAPWCRGTHSRECEVICAKCVVSVMPSPWLLQLVNIVRNWFNLAPTENAAAGLAFCLPNLDKCAVDEAIGMCMYACGQAPAWTPSSGTHSMFNLVCRAAHCC